ncbi:MAG: DUF4012 domain-containing protein [Acidimicrobiales bacterium]
MGVNWAYLAAEPAAFLVGTVLVRAGRPLLAERRKQVLGVLAGASGAGAVAAGGSATGWVALDHVLLIALGAAAVYAGSVVSSKVLLACGAAAAVLGAESAALALALGGIGLLLANLLDREPMLGAAAAGLVAQAALRLTTPDGRGLTALAAAVIFLAILVPAVATLGPAHRRLVRRVALGAAGFAFFGALMSGLAAWSTADRLREGLALAANAVTSGNPASTEQTAAQLAEAKRKFAGARRTLGAIWVRPAAAVPVVAQHWRVLHAAAVTGDEIATSAQRALAAPAVADIRVTNGQIPLDKVEAMTGPVGEVAADVSAAHRRLTEARSPLLLPPLLDKLDAELQRVARSEKTVQSLTRTLPLLPAMLGKEGLRRYFIAVQTPAEARAGGGFIGNYAELTADNGQLSLSRFGRPQELDWTAGANERQLDAPADFLERYGRFGPGFAWTNVNLSPDFPTDARVMASIYAQSTGTPLDGVIAVDPAGLAALLRLVGAVQVAGWPVPITADNAERIMLHEQYLLTDRTERIDFLGDVADAAWGRLTGDVLPPPQQLVNVLAPAARAKHLLLASLHADEQALYDHLGISGRVAPVQGDFVGLVTQNASANKIDFFLRRSLDYRVELDPGSRNLSATATVTLHNDAPPGGLPGTVIGNQALPPPLPDGYNRLYLSFYTPWALLDARLDGELVQLEEATELGRRVYSAGLVVPAEGSIKLELRLSGRLPDDGAYRLDVYRQPVVTPDEVTTTLNVGRGWRVGNAGRELRTTWRLESDHLITAPLRRS